MTLDIASTFADLAARYARETTTHMGGQEVRLVRFPAGEGQWHSHTTASETVLVWGGSFNVEYRDHVDHLTAGHVCIVAAGSEHRGTSTTGAELVLLKPQV